MAPKPTTVRTTLNPRDVTRALRIVERMDRIRDENDDAMDFYGISTKERDTLLQILKDLDARTGRREPHLRRPAKRSAKPAQRSAVRRAQRKGEKQR